MHLVDLVTGSCGRSLGSVGRKCWEGWAGGTKWVTHHSSSHLFLLLYMTVFHKLLAACYCGLLPPLSAVSLETNGAPLLLSSPTLPITLPAFSSGDSQQDLPSPMTPLDTKVEPFISSLLFDSPKLDMDKIGPVPAKYSLLHVRRGRSRRSLNRPYSRERMLPRYNTHVGGGGRDVGCGGRGGGWGWGVGGKEGDGVWGEVWGVEGGATLATPVTSTSLRTKL